MAYILDIIYLTYQDSMLNFILEHMLIIEMKSIIKGKK